ncbi:hypothetical protein FJW04_06255 [Mesorhizobium sp. B2-7-3]|uniref:hypothetical protein n=1 Tax=Mesorhizobium sp. B2-7-3 TaxID=2589907 RepID=UPI00112C4CD9|nr:hypothetical protein [Mesorhizobium sp. B2-7-3]TPJ18909.1 hypothetical protein FJW04_06255 [Mesorhizobium sp. B2-7-3]
MEQDFAALYSRSGRKSRQRSSAGDAAADLSALRSAGETIDDAACDYLVFPKGRGRLLKDGIAAKFLDAC